MGESPRKRRTVSDAAAELLDLYAAARLAATLSLERGRVRASPRLPFEETRINRRIDR